MHILPAQQVAMCSAVPSHPEEPNFAQALSLICPLPDDWVWLEMRHKFGPCAEQSKATPSSRFCMLSIVCLLAGDWV